MLSARPTAIEEAVDGMAEPKGDGAPGALRIDAQRDRLLAIPVEELARYRINARALEILPVLAVEVHHTALRKRVIALSIAQAEQLSWPILARLLPWIGSVDDFRRKIHSRAKRSPPPDDTPLWLRAHWRAVLGREAPAAALAEAGMADAPILARLLAHLQLPAGTPLSAAVLAAAVGSRDDAWLAAQPFTETLRFIEASGTAPSVRVDLTRRLLARYIADVADPAELIGPRLELMLLARRQLIGWPRPRAGLWHGLPTAVLQAGRWCQRRDELIAAFGAEDFRVTAWGRWLRHIQKIEPVGAVVGITLGARVFAEPAGAPTLCRVYSPPTWSDFVRRQSETERSLPPPRPEVRLPAGPEDRAGIDAFIQTRCGLA